MARLDGKHAIITGGAKGIGRSTAEAFVREGARVMIADIDKDAGQAVADSLGDAAFFQPLDVMQPDAWTAAAEAAKDKFGALQVLVNNAGGGVYGSVEETDLASFRFSHALNVDSVFLGMKACLPLMKTSGPGSIINVSSVAGMVGAPQMLAYCSAKGAVRLLSKSAAMDFARRGYSIRCNSVHPSFTDTPLVDTLVQAMGDADRARASLEKSIPLRRLGRPEEIASMILYLASDESSFVTGAELVVDGGLTTL
ncbi:MAG: glucose 1-dehydrogenase [Myxococcota bacterium]